MGSLSDGCVEVDVAVKLSLGVVSTVGPGIGVLGGVDVPQVEGVVLGVSSLYLDFKAVGGKLRTPKTTLEKH